MKIPTAWARNKLRIPQPQKGDEILATSAPAQGQPGKPSDQTAAALAAVIRSEDGAFPDQAALDAAIEQLPADALQRAMETVLAPAVDALRAGGTPDEAMDKLIEAYPKMDTEQLQALLARALFVADVWGRLSAEQENAGES